MFSLVKCQMKRGVSILKFYTAKNDIVFKTIMLSHQNILKKIIESILEEEIEDLTVLNNELTIINVKSKRRIVDIYIQIKNLYVNVELNANPKEYTNIRNSSYLFTIYSEGIKKGETYFRLKEKEFVGINLTYHSGKNIKEEYYLQTKEGTKFIHNFKIIEINMEKIRVEWYNLTKKEKERYKYLYMLDLDKESLMKFTRKEDSVLKEYEEALLKINQNSNYTPFITDEEDEMLMYKSDMQIAKRDGKIAANIETAKALLAMGVNTIEQIASATSLSVEEINKLKEGLEN